MFIDHLMFVNQSTIYPYGLFALISDKGTEIDELLVGLPFASSPGVTTQYSTTGEFADVVNVIFPFDPVYWLFIYTTPLPTEVTTVFVGNPITFADTNDPTLIGLRSAEV
jgi:hypothetical protein